MKKYKVTLLTQKGIIERIVNEGDDLEKLAGEITAQYGTFVTIKSVEI